MTKNYLYNGKWIENPNAIKVVLCTCGNKYIKTRPKQNACLECMKALAEAQK